jgi:glycogen debranching enzyme
MRAEPEIRFGRAICGDLTQAERREWWLADGRGGYAAGTVAGTLTRRYHGLLVAPAEPPLGRRLLLAKADATLVDGDRRLPLHSNRWGSGALAPEGYRQLESFRLLGNRVCWRYALGDLVLEQWLWLAVGAHICHCAWRLVQPVARPLTLEVTLLANDRDHHGETRPGDFGVTHAGGGCALDLRLRGPVWLQLRTDGGTLEPRRVWIEDFDLPRERERGLADRDAHLWVARLSLPLDGTWRGLTAGLNAGAGVSLPRALARRQRRDRALLRRASRAPDWVRRLMLTADSFVFARPLPALPDGRSVIAGYPWFGDWGRDTMIALPGLTLATGRPRVARCILLTFARLVADGLLPNTFPGAGDRPSYNSVDAALWYIEAWRAYLAATADRAALAEVFPVLAGIIAQYRDGTRHGIGRDPADGLLRAGAPGLQLTWMDAKVGDVVITPRHGKPVEINALWYHALVTMAAFARHLGRPGRDYRRLARAARRGFRRFLRPRGGLYDVLDGPAGDDPSVRPNQIFAVSLHCSPLTRAEQARVVAEVARDLLTSHGLRSLAADHPDYCGRYRGGVEARDRAYHQGTVWAWLLPQYALAEYRVHGDAGRALRWLEPLADHLWDAGLGSVSEIFDGDPPHAPRGAPSQAWSVGCLLQAWWVLGHAGHPVASPRTP